MPFNRLLTMYYYLEGRRGGGGGEEGEEGDYGKNTIKYTRYTCTQTHMYAHARTHHSKYTVGSFEYSTIITIV